MVEGICYKPSVRPELLIVLLIYMGIVLLVGVVFARKSPGLEGFFLASRNLGGWLVFFSLTASWIGASSTLVTVDQAFETGVSSFWVMGLPAVLTAVGFAVLLCNPIRRLPFITLPDLVEMRYGRLVRHLTSLLIVWYMVLLAASQMVAMGNFLGPLLRLPYLQALILGTAVVVAYSMVGGFFSVVLTDILQFGLLVGGILGLGIFLAGRAPLNDIAAAASQLGREGYWNYFQGWERNIWMVVSFVGAWTVSPIVWQRIQAARTPRHARLGLWGAALAFLVIYAGIVAVGILSLPLFSAGSRTGPLLSDLIAFRTGAVLSTALFVAVTAAVMSTLDTAINTGALSLTRDVAQRIFHFDREDMVLALSRISTFVVAVLALVIATRLQSILQALGLASEILTAGFFIPGVAMLFMQRRAPTAGLLSLALGGGYAVLAFFSAIGLIALPLPEWPYRVPYGLGLGLLGFLVGYARDRKRAEVPLPAAPDEL